MKTRLPTYGMCAVMLTLFAGAPPWASTPEKVFEAAEAYTVRVKTRIEKALGDDTAGVSSGTGFVVDAKRGWIVTNRHVVGESPSHVQVAMKSAPYADAEKVYVDPYIDLAVLHADVGAEEEARLDCRDMPGTGHPVGAYGHPWDLEYTGTQGVISGRTDNLGAEVLQTDAPINAGNSGGPLISMRSGKVVGIGTASYGNDDAENTNFAVSIVDACRILELLRTGEDPAPPRLDVGFYNLRDRDELIVARSYLDPDMLDLRPGDRILTAGSNAIEITKQSELINALRGELDNIELVVQRKGEHVTIRGRLDAHRVRNGILFAGMILAHLGNRDSSTLPSGHDIMIHSFVPGAAAQAVGLETYDILERIDGEPISNMVHMFDALSRTEPGQSVDFVFLRLFDGMQLFGYVQREVVADSPEWLSERDHWSGVQSQLAWKLDFLASNPSLSAEQREQHRASIASLLTAIDAEVESAQPETFNHIRELAAEALSILGGPHVASNGSREHGSSSRR